MLDEVFGVKLPLGSISDERAQIKGSRSTVSLKYSATMPVPEFETLLKENSGISGPYEVFRSSERKISELQWWDGAIEIGERSYLVMSPVYKGGNLCVYSIPDGNGFVRVFMRGVWRDDGG